MESAHKSNLSLTEYRQLEEDTHTRYEYHNGEVYAMAGGSAKHSAIATNVARLCGNLLPDDCRPFNSDLKVYIQAVDKGLYPDVSVACRPIELRNEINALINPVLLIEVLSESTANYDRGSKFRLFSHLPSLREYVLIEQHSQTVETRYRSLPDQHWEMAWFEGADTEATLRSVGIQLAINQIYAGTDEL